MLDALRDSLYTTAWFGLMTAVWLGWAQEAPPVRLRKVLIAGSIVGLLIAAGFGALTAVHWSDPTALDERYGLFGIIVGVEFALAGVGAAVLVMTGKGRWAAWWVALVVAVHFVSLALLFRGPSLAWLGAVEVVALGVGAFVIKTTHLDSAPTLRDGPTSAWVGPVMGLTILAYAVVNGVVTLQRLAGS